MRGFIELFKKADGKEFLRQSAQAHILFYTLFMAMMLGKDKKSLEILRLAVQNKKLKKLRKKYRKFIKRYKNGTEEANEGPNFKTERKIWVCWFQGMEHAPVIVKKCYESIKEYIKDREIILITQENYKDYVTFPDYITEKMDAGVISKTHLSDLLRLEILIKYGGTWIDATVLCTSTPDPFYLDSEFFLFQTMKPGLDGKCTSISNWFISSDPGNPILQLTLDLLYEYWKNNDKLIDYYLFHDMFQLASEAYTVSWGKVVPVSNEIPHALQLRMFEKYDDNVWKNIKMQTPFHKLTYKFDEDLLDLEGTFYKELFCYTES